MQSFGKIPNHPEGKKYIAVEVTNINNRKTTITHLVGFYYKSLFRKIRGKKDKSFIIVPPALLPPPLPHVLEPGERWVGGIKQTCG